MALAPKFAAQRLSAIKIPPTHTLEVYLDYVCPFSAKLFKTLYRTIYPAVIATSPHYSQRITILFRHQIQPWHPTSTLVHEAALAVLKVSPEQFWPFSARLFEVQKQFFDEAVVEEARNETYARLAALAGEVGVDGGRVMGLLRVRTLNEDGDGMEEIENTGDGAKNEGNGVTADLKTVIKMARLVGVHVSPTVVWDGIVRNEISSSWGEKEWREWLKANVDEDEA